MAVPGVTNSIWMNYMGAEIRFVQGKKFRTRLAEAGDKNAPPLILTHGGGGHLETFAFNVVPLGQHFHTIGVEMLWHGLSDAPPITDAPAQIGEQVLDVMEALGIERAWLHGEAAAASTVTWMALNHPEKLIGVVYESSGGIRFKEGSVKPPLPPVGGIPMGERTLILLKDPTWQGVKDRLLMVMHYQHPERVTDELVDVRLAHYSRPSTNDAQTRYYSRMGTGAPLPTEEDIATLPCRCWSPGATAAAVRAPTPASAWRR